MRKQTAARTVLAGLVILLSFVPQVIVFPLLGEINLVLLLLLWVAFLFIRSFLTRRKMLFVAVLCALVMAFPPIPDWMWYSDSGGLFFRFIGWDNLSREAYGIVFFFLAYLAIFVSVALLSGSPSNVDHLHCQ